MNDPRCWPIPLAGQITTKQNCHCCSQQSQCWLRTSSLLRRGLFLSSTGVPDFLEDCRQCSGSSQWMSLLRHEVHVQVLDTCAAPGSKTAQILEMLHQGLTAIPTGMFGMFFSLNASWHHIAASLFFRARA